MNQMADQHGRGVQVGDDASLDRMDGVDVRAGTSDKLLRLPTDAHDRARSAIDGHR